MAAKTSACGVVILALPSLPLPFGNGPAPGSAADRDF